MSKKKRATMLLFLIVALLPQKKVINNQFLYYFFFVTLWPLKLLTKRKVMKRFILFAILLLGALFVTQAVTSTSTATNEEHTITAAPMDDVFTFTVANLPTPEAYLFV